MKKLLLFVSMAFAANGFAQTTIYQENFETGNSFTMNSSDLGGSSTYNTWLKNNTYAGGSGTFVCLGFPFAFTVNNTPSQPSGITGFPSSSYMHIAAQSAISSGINCASYIPADGTCALNESNFAKMTSAISTVGFINVNFDFWWMCAGSSTAFGELYYSLDGGTTWTLKQSNFNNTTNWAQTVITDPLWSNQASLKFAFRFSNTTASTAADPPFCVDQIVVSGAASTNSISIVSIQPQLEWCAGSTPSLQIIFNSIGTYNAGNVFTCQLSDASGSFASPTVIGSFAGTSTGNQLIGGNIPGSIPVGTGYRIRVVASDPVTIGTDNGVDLVVMPSPTVTLQPFFDVCESSIAIPLMGESPSGGVFSGQNVSGSFFTPSVVGATIITYTYTEANGCSGSATQQITVHPTPVVSINPPTPLCIADAPFAMQYGAPAGGNYTGPGVTANMFSPAVAGVGVHSIVYEFINSSGCSDSEVFIIVVESCASISENDTIGLLIYPNPAKDFITISADVELLTIVLLDVNGRIVRVIEKQGMVSVSDLNAGVYFLQMEHDGQRFVERITVK